MNSFKFDLILIVQLSIIGFAVKSHVENPHFIDADANSRSSPAPLTHFWKSTGFCPPLPHQNAAEYFLSQDQQLNLAFVGSVPRGGIQQVRVHWMFNLISVRKENNIVQYNFTQLDHFLVQLHCNGLKPGFELMGNPSGYFTDFEDKTQVVQWRDLVTVLAKRYINKFGLSYVSEWNFETWNEPDHHDFDNVSMTEQGFLNYYDACSEGLKKAHLHLRLGGPGGSLRTPPASPVCWGLLDHCTKGTNFFTGKRGVRLDYIAMHKKGSGSSLRILEQEKETVERIAHRYPEYSTMPIYNDEADPLVGWSKPEEWRADVTYAAMVVKIICQHQQLILRKPNNTINYVLLSNDNGFLSYTPHHFTQRTLTARFQVNVTQPPHVQLLRKPVLSAMALLALLGEEEMAVKMSSGEFEGQDMLGVLGSLHQSSGLSTDSSRWALLLYNSNDVQHSAHDCSITVTIRHLPSSQGLLYRTYRLDNNQTNPYQIWRSMGKPRYPTPNQFHRMREAEGPIMSKLMAVPVGGTLQLHEILPQPSVYLLHVCARPTSNPGQATGVRILPLTQVQCMVVWSDERVESGCLKTYEVEFSSSGKLYRRINDRDTIFTLFVFSPKAMGQGDTVTGYYRVRAVDYWSQAGKFSSPIYYHDVFSQEIK
uniref:Alpha-L-iduronidase n=3 Tax=Eptatretus burgeri TaxID=7764 RepID=A0A8C4Q2R4_EPTBU